jgi:hypothetical protein
VARLPPAREEELKSDSKPADGKSGRAPSPADEQASAAALAALRQAEADLRGMEAIVERVRGLLALALSFHEAGDHTESMNLSTLARAEIAKALRSGPVREGAGIRLRYTLLGMGNPEEAAWIAQSERVAYDHAVQEVARALGLLAGRPQQSGQGEEVEIADESGDVELRLHRLAVREVDSMVVQVTGVVGDPAVFRAVSAALKQKLAQVWEFVDRFASVPPPAEGDLVEYLKVLAERLNAKVEEAIILHADGRMMCHVTSTESAGIDYDLVGSMLLALRAFVRDSFAGDFEEVGFGDKRMLLVQGNYVLAALLMRGEASEGFRVALRASIGKMETELKSEILNWIGIGTIAEKMLPFLEPLVKGAKLGTPPA